MAQRPRILLIEERPGQMLIKQINLSLYLEAEVLCPQNLTELKESLKEGAGLIIIKTESPMMEYISSQECPYIEYSAETSPPHPSITISQSLDLRPLIQEAAKVLGVSAKDMASRIVPDYYAFKSGLLNYLNKAPVDLYKDNENGFEIAWKQGLPLNEHSLKTYCEEKSNIYIRKEKRLEFVQNLTTGLLLKFSNGDVPPALSETHSAIEGLAKKFQENGIDQEAIALAEETYKKLASELDKFSDFEFLMSGLKYEDMNYRSVHTHLIMFMGLHVLKTLNWWIEGQRESFAYACIFHDILFEDDLLASVHNQELLDEEDLSADQKSLVLEHAKKTSELIAGDERFPEHASQIIREHHCGEDGVGLETAAFDSLHALSKVFVICEEAVHAELQNSITDHEAFLEGLNEKYEGDEDAIQIIEAISNLDTALIFSNVTDDISEEHFRVSGRVDPNDELVKVSGGKNQELLDEVMKISGVLSTMHEENIRIEGVSDSFDEIKNSIGSLSSDDEKEAILKVKKLQTKLEEKVKENPKELLDKRSKDGRTPMMIASLRGDIKAIEFLVNSGADYKLKDPTGLGSIHFAAIGGHKDIVDYFVSKGLNINLQDSKRRTPVFMAILHRHDELATALLSEGAWGHIVIDDGMNLVMLAASLGNVPMIEKVVQHKANINAKDNKGKNAFYYAKAKKQKEAMKYLHSKGVGK